MDQETKHNNEIRVAADDLQTFAHDVFVRVGLPPINAALAAEVLVWANMRGIDSHGVLRIPQYLDFVKKRLMNPRPNVQIIRETPAVLFMDADRAFGPIATVPAMKQAITKARRVGIGWALIRNVTHQGALGYYALLAAAQGMVGLAIVCSPPNMAPFGAKARGLHNSPIAIAAPAGQHLPLVLDMATSVAAGGKLTLASDQGAPLPEGWALDADGNPTTDADQAHILLPAGAFKGSGLALMFQCLTSIMASNPLVTPTLQGKDPGHNQNSVVAAIDIGLFTGLEGFKQSVDEHIDAIKNLPKAEGFDGILVPGEPEHNTLKQRLRHGIPLPPGTVEKLREVARRFRLNLPAGL